MKKTLLISAIIICSFNVYSQNQLTNMEKMEGFELLINGESLHGWVGNKTDYVVETVCGFKV